MAYPPPPYADARTGTPLTGEAVTGAWWAYPPSAKLSLGAVVPQVNAISGNVPPPARLTLGGYAPQLSYNRTLAAPAARLALGGEAPEFALSTLLTAPQARLLLGADAPQFVGMTLLLPVYCVTTVSLQAVSEPDLILEEATGASVSLVEG